MSTFTEFRDAFIKLGLPLLGAALPLPGGAAIGTALAGMLGNANAAPEEIVALLTKDASSLQKAREFEATHQEVLLRIQVDAEIADRKAASADIEAVNATIREELKGSKDEEWYQKAWRPANGFAVAIGSLVGVCGCCVLVVLAINTGRMDIIQHIPTLAFNIGVILSVPGAAVGIASWHRGLAQRNK